MGTEAGLEAALADFEEARGMIDPDENPLHHGMVEHSVGVNCSALAKLSEEGRSAFLQEAIRAFNNSLEVFSRTGFPYYHALVKHNLGLAHEAQGGTDNERAAAYNNLGLCRTEMGQADAGVEAFNAAIKLFDSYTDEGKRGIMSTLHNRGQAHTALNTEAGLEAALADFEEARGMIDPEEKPLHYGMVEHSVGVTCSALAKAAEDGRSAFLQEAIRAFNNSLLVFTRTAFPYYYALVKHNLGLAYESQGGVANLRRALTSFEDALGVFDTRLHAEAWKTAFASLDRVEKQLNATEAKSRIDHWAALLAVAGLEERTVLVRERMFRLLALPEPRRTTTVAEVARAVGLLGYDDGRKVYESIMKLVIQLPQDTQSASLRAIIEGHRSIEDAEVREDADRALDQAIGDALGGPQRVAVRDFLEGEGWERP